MSFSEKNFDVIEAWEHNGVLVDNSYPELAESVHRRICWAYFDVLDKMAISNEKNFNEQRESIKRFLYSNFTFVMKNHVFTKGRKLSMLALRVNDSCYNALAKFKYNHLTKKND